MLTCRYESPASGHPLLNDEHYPQEDMFARRSVKMVVAEPSERELLLILKHRLKQRQSQPPLEISDDVLQLIAVQAAQQPGSNPASAISLLEMVLSHAKLNRSEVVGPDDVYHLVQRNRD